MRHRTGVPAHGRAARSGAIGAGWWTSRSWATIPSLPDYAGACVHNIVPGRWSAGGPTARCPAWMPAPVGDARQVVLLVLDGLGWEQLEAAPGAGAHAGVDDRRADPHGGAVDHRHRADLDHHRPDAGGARRHRLPHRRARRGAQRAALVDAGSGDARRRIPPGAVPAVAALPRRQRPGRHQGRVRRVGVLAGPPRRRAPDRLPDAVDAGGRGAPAARAAASRSSTPTTRASTRWPTSTASTSTTTPSWPPPTASWPSCCAVLPAGAVLAGDRRPRPGRLRRPPRHARRRRARPRRAPVGRGRFRWLHARPGRAPPTCSTPPPTPTRDVAWVVPVEQVRDEGWFGPRLSRRRRRSAGRRGLVAREPVAFDDPADSGPFRLICRHGSLTAAEMHVPLLAGDRA